MKTLFEEIFILSQEDADYTSSELETIMKLKKGVITDEIMRDLLKCLSKYDAEKLYELDEKDIANELKKLGISDNDYNLLLQIVACEGYDYSKTLKMLYKGIQQQQNKSNK
ncbi:hypothetical protein [Proteus mirabilis]|uniref:hypothetical protein n=1 Tax=Proteus mirabilis TaxID=584 RepID=UPI0034D46D13